MQKKIIIMMNKNYFDFKKIDEKFTAQAMTLSTRMWR